MRPLPPLRPVAALALFVLCAATAPVPPPDVVAQRMQEAMGGERFDDARVLRFTWWVERDGERVGEWKHSWDRWTGAYRLEGTERDTGAPVLALFDVDTREGRVWVGDRALEGDELATWLERAYGRFINDTYWLLMPWKWLDPGVNRTLKDTAEVDGTLCDVVELTFGDVGLTSGDRYLGYVDRSTRRMIRWSYVLQEEDGTPGSAEPSVWNWEGWREVPPGVWFAERKRRVGGEGAVSILTDDIELHTAPSDEQLAEWFQTP